jgi:hypothetical protein
LTFGTLFLFLLYIINACFCRISFSQNEDEWKEFEEERKDYTGLKIGTLTINEDENKDAPEGSTEGGQNENDGSSENTGGERKTSGPWKKVEGSEAPIVAPKPIQVQEIVSAPKQSVYVSPAYRSQMAAASSAAARPKKKGTAPDLKSEEYFPTLGTEKPLDPSKNKHRDPTFEEVKHGSRVKASDLPHAAPLSIENRFTSLSNDAS